MTHAEQQQDLFSKNTVGHMNTKAKHFLDITEDVCPMTFVKTRLLIERMAENDIAEILLKGEEPLQNVPESVQELGHRIISLDPAAPSAAATDSTPETLSDLVVMRLIIEKR